MFNGYSKHYDSLSQSGKSGMARDIASGTITVFFATLFFFVAFSERTLDNALNGVFFAFGVCLFGNLLVSAIAGNKK